MLELNSKNFKKEILESKAPALVDFYADWCGPCKILSPIIEELAEEYQGKPVKIMKLNVDDVSDIASQYGVMSIPTLMFFKNGKVVEQLVGIQEKRKLQLRIAALIK